MPSERRLHPASVLFNLAAQVKNLVLPGVLVLFGASRAGADWEPWLMLLLIPYTLTAIVRYVSFRYRYDPNEMVIRSGLLFRNERHVPYARIQNLDAVQTVAHRLLGVVKVRVQTGAGSEPEAVMSVIPVAAFEEMRRRVFEQRSVTSLDAAVNETVAPEGPRAILHLSTRELLICGFIENRGVVVMAAAFGLLAEMGFVDPWFERIFGDETSARGVMRGLITTLFGGGGLSPRQVAVTLAAFLGLLVFVRILSMGWAVIRLYDFRLSRAGEDLRTEFGLLTRVVATIPRHRIQTLTVREGPLHRLFGRVAVRVATAGGKPGEGAGSAAADLAWLAPIVRSADLPRLLHEVLPELDLARVNWQGVHALTFRRAFRSWLFVALPPAFAFAIVLTWWTPVFVAGVIAWALVDARQYVRHVGWAITESVAIFRHGWIWKRTTVARVAKIQAVTLKASPFDRRYTMARVKVDTAGAGEDRVDIPFLARDTANALRASLSAAAARTEFKW